jgi:hypothetical protein
MNEPPIVEPMADEYKIGTKNDVAGPCVIVKVGRKTPRRDLGVKFE